MKFYLICEVSRWNTYNEKQSWNKAKSWMTIWRQNKIKPQTKPRWGQLHTLIVRHRPFEIARLGSRNLIWGPTHRRAVKQGSKVINHNLVNNHACSLPQNINVVTFIATDNLFKKNSVLPTIFLNFNRLSPIKFRFGQKVLQKAYFITNVEWTYK